MNNAFGYNAKSEVTSATMGDNQYGYDYDPIGNRVLASLNAATNTYAANALNQYAIITNSVSSVPPCEIKPVYDLDGNILTNGVWSFRWDAENRMVAAYSNDTLLAVNAYDDQSRRIRKVTAQGTRTFLYDGWNVLRETAGASTNYFLWGLDLSGTMQGAGGVGGLLAVVVDGAAPATYYPCYDANGNITEYVDELGIVRAEYAYDAFGQTISQGGDMATTFSHRFSTKYADDETGLYYYGYRFYAPGLGRWASRDPLEEKGGLNLYGFIENNPLDKHDILGMFSLPNHWMAKLYSYLVNKYPLSPFQISSAVASLFLRINSWRGDDPWINRFLDNYFTGQKTRLTLSVDEVKQLTLTDDFNFIRIPGFFDQTIVNEAKYPELLRIKGKGPGNKTLGNFSARYKGKVCNDRFDGYFKIEDTFDFDWQFFLGERSVIGELTVMYFTTVTIGSEFDVDSEWINISQEHKNGWAKWR